MTIRAIIGLGNPGPRFFNTRHNIGFRVLDKLAEQFDQSFSNQHNADIASISSPQGSVLLIKPQTFMNSSGLVAPLLQKKGIKADEILVVHDELELPFGTIKLKKGGSAKGHNGLRSCIAHLGEGFWRLRIGIGRPDDRVLVPDYVLAPFKESAETMQQYIDKAAQQLVEIIENPSLLKT